MEEEIPVSDPPLSLEQEALVAQLTSEQIEEIDAVLISNAKPRWR